MRQTDTNVPRVWTERKMAKQNSEIYQWKLERTKRDDHRRNGEIKKSPLA